MPSKISPVADNLLLVLLLCASLPLSPSMFSAAELAPALQRLATALCRVDSFYDSMGGLVGYQLKSIELILAGSAEAAAAAAATAAAEEQRKAHVRSPSHLLMRKATNGRANGVTAAAAAGRNGNGKHAVVKVDLSSAAAAGGGSKNGKSRAKGAAAAEVGTASNGSAYTSSSSAAATAAAAVAAAAARPAEASAAEDGAGIPGSAVQTAYHVPPCLDLAGPGGRQLGIKAAAQGILAMPHMAEILPVGGEQHKQGKGVRGGM